MDTITTIYQDMDDDDLYDINDEANAEAKILVERFNQSDYIDSYKQFFNRNDILDILVSGFNYSQLKRNNASDDRYNYFMSCLVKYMVKSGLFENLSLADYISQGVVGAVYSGNILPTVQGGRPSRDLFAGKINKEKHNNINQEILAGFVLNSTKPLVPNFAYQYSYKDCIKYNPNWCNDTTRLSISQFVNGNTLYDFLEETTLYESKYNIPINFKKGVVSGNLYNPEYKDESNDNSNYEEPSDHDTFTERDLDAIVLQLFSALNVAYSMHGFVHHDLHTRNIMVQQLRESVLIPIYYSNDAIVKDGIIQNIDYFYVKTRYIPIMFDYGLSNFDFQGKEYKNVLYDNIPDNNLLYSRKYPSSDFFSILYGVGGYDDRYDKLCTELFGSLDGKRELRNDYEYTHIDIIAKVMELAISGTMQNGVFASSNSKVRKFNREKIFIDPLDFVVDTSISTPNQRCVSEMYHLDSDMSNYDDESFVNEANRIVTILRENIDDYTRFYQEKMNNKNFQKIDGMYDEISNFTYLYNDETGKRDIHIERYISELDMICYDFGNFIELYDFIDGIHYDMLLVNSGKPRTADMGRLAIFLKSRAD